MSTHEMPTAIADKIGLIVSTLPTEKASILLEMAKSLQTSVDAEILAASDIVSDSFNVDFSGRLVLFHAMHDALLTKKTFEHFFLGASRACGRSAPQNPNSVFAGEDVTVDGTKFSLKTESGRSIDREKIHISKLMEARWIRECTSGEEFNTLVQERVVSHLSHYDRILTLRSFATSETSFMYQLVEIPKVVLLSIQRLVPSDYSPRTPNGSTRAIIRGHDGRHLFALSLDGSVEKVTIRSLLLSSCVVHVTWRLRQKE